MRVYPLVLILPHLPRLSPIFGMQIQNGKYVGLKMAYRKDKCLAGRDVTHFLLNCTAVNQCRAAPMG